MKVGYIIKNKKGKYRPFVGKPVESEGDNDSCLFVLAKGPLYDKIEDAQTFLKNNDQGIDRIFLKPVNASTMGTWMSVLELNEKSNPHN